MQLTILIFLCILIAALHRSSTGFAFRNPTSSSGSFPSNPSNLPNLKPWFIGSRVIDQGENALPLWAIALSNKPLKIQCVSSRV